MQENLCIPILQNDVLIVFLALSPTRNLREGVSRSRGHRNVMILLSRNSHKTLIQGKEATFPGTSKKVETQSLEMSSKLFFLVCRSPKDQNGK